MNRKLVFSYLFSAALVAVLLYLVDVGAVWERVAALGGGNALLLMALYAPTLFFRAVKWRVLVEPFGALPLRTAFNYSNIGLLVNNVLPARAGEFAKAYLLSKRLSIGKVKAFSTVLVERVTDGVTMVALLAIALVMVRLPESFELLVFAVVFFWLSLMAAFLRPRFVYHVVKPFAFLHRGLAERVKAIAQDLSLGALALRRGGIRAHAAVWASSLIVWALHAGMIAWAAGLMGIEFSLAHALLLSSLAGFGVMAPSAPAYLGTVEAVFYAYFLAFGLDVNAGIALAVVVHVSQVLAVNVAGLASVHDEKLSWKALERLTRKKSE